jgi:phosphoribosylformimino-5-aminoimidazole carboxamide ribotide isomerase
VLARDFEVLPAIDVLDGRVVRLREGRRDSVTLEGGDPVAVATRFADEGASRLHVVDLDGAFSGTPSVDLVERLAAIGPPVQIGGGYRTVAAVAAALDAGADRVIVGTAAVSPDFLAEALATAGDRLVVAVDVTDGRLAISGWVELAELDPLELARRCAGAQVARVLVTSTRRDGSLAGPDLPLLAAVVDTGPPVIAAGGISSVDDLVRVRAAGCEAAIAGSALLAGRFTLADAAAALTDRS